MKAMRMGAMRTRMLILLFARAFASVGADLNVTQLDCGMRVLALKFASQTLRSRTSVHISPHLLNHNNNNECVGVARGTHCNSEVLRHVREALEMDWLCPDFGAPRDSGHTNHDDNGIRNDVAQQDITRSNANDIDCPLDCPRCCVYVAPSSITLQEDGQHAHTGFLFHRQPSASSSTHPDGSFDRPFISIHDAIAHVRRMRSHHRKHAFRRNINITANHNSTQGERSRRRDNDSHHSSIPSRFHVVLRQGVHHMLKTLVLTADDSNITIRSIVGEHATIGGGVPLPPDLPWRPCQSPRCATSSILVANLGTILSPEAHAPNPPSLFTSTARYIRARYPNSNPETDQWGYASHNRANYSIPSHDVLEWRKPEPDPSNVPNFTYIDFASNRDCSIPQKHDSAQDGYNLYASGHGGVCATLWGPGADSYWCSNASSGGWAEVDQECAITGQLNIPVGMTYNRSTDVGQFLQTTKNSAGGIVHAWHSQSWAMHMFQIAAHNKSSASLTFASGGGKQGGRNWCRCDQCTYAGSWCRQHQNPPDDTDTRLISGSWVVEHVLEALDQPGEFFYDASSMDLYVFPNRTQDLKDFTFGWIERLIEIHDGAVGVRLEGIRFQHTKATYMDGNWSAPSGGDWALHRNGAVFIEQASNITVRNCEFHRIDGNAIFLSGRTRHVDIRYNKFEWLGENAIATWGNTDAFDATAGDFPVSTFIEGNVMREVGIYQKQSSGIGQAKAAKTTIRKNIMFNMPRAAINFNDMVGGGDIIEGNLIFNTCRESGDHGPINSWDRQPFLTTLRDGITPSFRPLHRQIRSNFIFANYGGSQGVDNDDGSSWYNISRNVFYMAEGFKMDYGGHDSIFHDNLILSYPYDNSQCFNVASFLKDHEDRLYNNICVVGLGRHFLDSGCGNPTCASQAPVDETSMEVVGYIWEDCDKTRLRLSNNTYFTNNGTAVIHCGGRQHTIEEMQRLHGLEVGSTYHKTPRARALVDMASAMLFNGDAEHLLPQRLPTSPLPPATATSTEPATAKLRSLRMPRR